MPRSSQITDAGPIAKLIPTAAALTIFQALNPKLQAPSLAAILGIPGTGRLRARLFEVQISGYATAASAGNLTISIQAGTDTNTANNTTIATSGAVAVTQGATVSFSGTLRLIYNPISGALEGTHSWIVNNTPVAAAAITGAITGLSDANEPVFSLVAGALLSVVNAASYIQVDTFAVED